MSMITTEMPLKIIECPRDAMQGMVDFVPTDLKVAYLNLLLKAGFHTLDFGSFVSPKAIPQMRDTAQVVDKLELDNSTTKLLAIIANKRGAEEACAFEQISYLGFPLSLSETFQQRNTNKSIAEALLEVEEIQNLMALHSKSLVVYLSMGFGNPYGDPFSIEIYDAFVQKLAQLGVSIICPSDTIGVAEPNSITTLFNSLITRFPSIEFGAHFHSVPALSEEKIEAAYQAGCRRFDGAIRGFGGCPLAKDDLVGNIATEKMVAYFSSKHRNLTIHQENLNLAVLASNKIFS